jgi:thiosulfate/3-mercaptopyruvate sulfurtransferase
MMTTNADTAVDSLVSTEWLADHLDDRDLRILDIRGYVHHIDDGKGNMEVVYAAAPDEYAAGHIPGAAYVDWTRDITDPDDAVPIQIAPPGRFAAWASGIGIGDTTHVVIYDHQGTTLATRLWWCFAYYGHDRVSVLDGGWKKWAAEDRPTTTDIPTIAATSFRPHTRSALRKTIAEVAAISTGRTAQLIDARPADQYAGAVVRSGRAGHIPGAVSLPATTLINPETGTWKSDEELADIVQGAGVTADEPIVAYCGGGVAATGVLFALHRTGHHNWANYDGSWNEYGPRTDLPAERSLDPEETKKP